MQIEEELTNRIERASRRPNLNDVAVLKEMREQMDEPGYSDRQRASIDRRIESLEWREAEAARKRRLQDGMTMAEIIDQLPRSAF